MKKCNKTLLISVVLLFSMNACAIDKNPCSKDMAKYCKNLQADTPAMMDCLEKHEGDLSNECKAYETKMGGNRVEMKEEVRGLNALRQDCREDELKFCKNVDPAQDGLLKCLKKNEKALSVACTNSIKEQQNEQKTK